MEEQAKTLFMKAFGLKDLKNTVGVRAPGRVNLIGEHTDYQEGFVMPIAIELETFVVAKLSETTDECRVVSAQQKEIVESFAVNSELAPGESKWFKYVQGVIMEYYQRELKGKTIHFDAAFASNVPLGGGLSSSASLEVATAKAIEALYKLSQITLPDTALRCVNAEHRFAKVPCGVMDQFASAMSVEGNALFLDCRTKQVKNIPLTDPSIAFVITNSNAPHVLSGSEYPDRVRQCISAVKAVKEAEQNLPDKSTEDIKALRDVSLNLLEKHKAKLDDLSYRRAKHVISENSRVQAAVIAISDKNYEKLGQLMLKSHFSLRDDFEVSTKELDMLVDIAMNVEGVYGSRMTGGGFGGCTVTLVKSDQAQTLIDTLHKEYKARTNSIDCTCFITRPAAGAQVVWSN